MQQQKNVQEDLSPKDNLVLVPSEDQRHLLLENLQEGFDLTMGPKCCYTACVRCVS